MRPSGHLCSRCGGREHVQVSATELRCVDCGLGSTFGRLTAVSDDNPRPAEEQAGIDRLMAMMGRQEQSFVDADFSPFALDQRWTGLRSIGGHGASNGTTDRLSLAHGYVMDPEAAQVRVETRRPRPIGLDGPRDRAMERFLATQDLVRQLVQETGNLRDDVRAAAFPYGQAPQGQPSPDRPVDVPRDPTEPWADTTMPVDEVPVPFKVLADGDAWVALAEHGDLFIGITSRRWPRADTGLVSITDFRVYVEGSEEITARARRDHPPTT